MKEKLKKQTGITLIALIISIIVMLILAAVSINIIINQGIMTKSKEAVNRYNEKAGEEQANLTAWEQLMGQYSDEGDAELDIETALQIFTANPQNYIHPEQSSTNKDRAIGTDGKAVNLDLWDYSILNEENGEIVLSNVSYGCEANGPSYSNNDIIDGKIKGTVPQYIYLEENKKVYVVSSMNNVFIGCTNLEYSPQIPTTVKELDYTFIGCTNLKKAPEIPNTVESMDETFKYCTSLTQAPDIPSSVKIMSYIFAGCTNLTGTVRINSTSIEKKSWESKIDCFTNITNNITVQVPANSTTYNTFNEAYGSSSNITIETF